MLRVSAITTGELRAGVLAANEVSTRATRLTTYHNAVRLEPVPVDERVAERWAELRVQLRKADTKMPINDLWIAATALVLDIPVVTQDADYDVCPGLAVIRV